MEVLLKFKAGVNAKDNVSWGEAMDWLSGSRVKVMVVIRGGLRGESNQTADNPMASETAMHIYKTRGN